MSDDLVPRPPDTIDSKGRPHYGVSKMGRPSKLTDDVQEKICGLIKHGNYPSVAARASGIDDSTFRRWMMRGADTVDTDGRLLQRASPRYKLFRLAVEEAHAEGEASLVLQLRLLGQNGDSKAHMFLLERGHNERWGKVVRQELSGPGGKPIEHRVRPDLSKLTDEELETLDQLVGRATPLPG